MHKRVNAEKASMWGHFTKIFLPETNLFIQ